MEERRRVVVLYGDLQRKVKERKSTEKKGLVIIRLVGEGKGKKQK